MHDISYVIISKICRRKLEVLSEGFEMRMQFCFVSVYDDYEIIDSSNVSQDCGLQHVSVKTSDICDKNLVD